MIDTSSFPKAKRYWYMGKMYDWSEFTLHPMTHALHYGTSVFEGIRCYATDRGPAIFRLTEHVDRFMLSASVAKMIPPYGKGEIIRSIKQTVRENDLESCYIRPLLFYSYGNLGLVPKASPVQLVIGAWEWGAYLGEKADAGVSVYLLPWRRIHHSQLDMRAKLGGAYVQSTICGLEARAQGCDEAVFLNLEGRIAEGPGENIFLVKNGVLQTNDRTESILEGITRTSVVEIARDLGYTVEIAPITKDEMLRRRRNLLHRHRRRGRPGRQGPGRLERRGRQEGIHDRDGSDRGGHAEDPQDLPRDRRGPDAQVREVADVCE